MSRSPPKLRPEQMLTYADAVERMGHISDYDQEVVMIVTFGTDNRVIDDHLIAIGSMEEANVDIRIVMNRVLIDKAQGFILGHNHTTGKAYFSEADFLLMARLRYICEVIGICFVDSIIFPHGKKPVRVTKRNPKFWKKDFKSLMESSGISSLL
jgi:DNA repair protein RadC